MANERLKAKAFHTTYTVTTSYGTGIDVGFVATKWRFNIASGTGPVDISYDGITTPSPTVHGILGPAATRAKELEDNMSSSIVYLKSAAGGETVDIWARP